MTILNSLFCFLLALMMMPMVFAIRRRGGMGSVLWTARSAYSGTLGSVYVVLASFRTADIFYSGVGSASPLDWTRAFLFWVVAVALLTRQFSMKVFERGISVSGLLLDWSQISGWYLGAPSDSAVSLDLSVAGQRNLYLSAHSRWLFFWRSRPINTRVKCAPELEALLNQHLPGKRK